MSDFWSTPWTIPMLGSLIRPGRIGAREKLDF
jgi:hypothetical protein